MRIHWKEVAYRNVFSFLRACSNWIQPATPTMIFWKSQSLWFPPINYCNIISIGSGRVFTTEQCWCEQRQHGWLYSTLFSCRINSQGNVSGSRLIIVSSFVIHVVMLQLLLEWNANLQHRNRQSKTVIEVTRNVNLRELLQCMWLILVHISIQKAVISGVFLYF